jgi:hypothetical protein
MKIISALFFTAAMFMGSLTVFASEHTPVATTLIDLDTDTYLGAISYEGGLLERGRLELQNVEDISYIRFDIPDHCRAEIFQAGTSTEGVDDLAEVTSNPSVFAVNQGRGNHVRGVFVSLNGPVGQNCSVLVFKRNSPGQLPDGRTQYAVTCVENPFPFAIAVRLTAPGTSTDMVLPPHRTTILNHALRLGEFPPSLNIGFDRDLSFGVFWANYILASVNSRSIDCATAPFYRFVNPGFNMIDLIRAR